MATVEFDMSEYKEFFRRMERAAKGDFREELELYLESVGYEFLRIVQDEIIRRKSIEYTPMTEEEAMIQVDLIGHDFFVYTDRDTGNVHVIYRRSDGGFGLLTPAE